MFRKADELGCSGALTRWVWPFQGTRVAQTGSPRTRPAVSPAALPIRHIGCVNCSSHGCQGSGGAPTASAERCLWETKGDFTLGSDVRTRYESELMKPLWGFSAQLLGMGI